MRRRAGIFLATLFATAAAVAPAQASSVAVVDGTLTYLAAPGEANDVDVFLYSRDDALVIENGPNVDLGPGCDPYPDRPPSWVRCGGPIERVYIDAGDGDDHAGMSSGSLGPAEIHGGPGDDRIAGSNGADRLYGDGGVNTIEAYGGDDMIEAGTGPSADVRAGAGNDTVHGTPGNDIIWGGGGSDTIAGGAGADDLEGWDGWSSKYTQDDRPDGNDTIDGGPGRDLLDGGPGSDSITGGSDIDEVRYADRPEPLTVTLDGASGDGAASENDYIAPDVEALQGGDGNDTLVGNGGQNWIDGWQGDDVIAGGGDGDVLLGDDGADRIFGGNAPEGTAPVVDPDAPDAGDDIAGGLGDDMLVGGAGQDRFAGDEGADAIDAREPGDGPEVAGESVACGTGVDAAQLDGNDLPTDCEVMQRSGRPGDPGSGDPFTADPFPGSTPGDPPVVPPPPDQTVVLDEPHVFVKRGAIAFRLRCVAHSASRCRGRAGADAGRTRTLARRSFSLSTRRRTTVRVKLTRSARRLIRRRGKVRALATVTVRQPGGPPAEWSRPIVIRAGRL